MKMQAAVVLGLALAGPAQAEKVVRCDASLERSVGAVDVPGWGPDEPTARARAREMAWILAWADRWPAVAAGTIAVPEDLARREQALRKRLDPATDWRVPGYAVRDGACTTESVDGAKNNAWAARWEREDRKVVRSDPSVAIEAARRRQCFGAWSHRMVAAAGLGKEAGTERFAAVWPGARAATDGLIRCVTRGSHDVTGAGSPLPEPDVGGVVECRRPRRDAGVWTATPGWGSSFESAREASLKADLGNRIRKSERAMAGIARIPDPAQRAQVVEASALGLLASVVVATDLAEQATLSCHVDAPKTVRPTWTLPEGQRCAGWTTGQWTASGPDLEVVRDRTCAEGFRQGAVGGDWEEALACATSCRSDLESAGWTGRLVWRPNEPGRASVEEAEMLLSRALADKDFHLLGIVTGGVIFEASHAAAFKADPGAFWGSIEGARKSGSWEQLAYWEQVDGAWVLAFKDAQ